jgi:hypothetical protein
MIWFNSKNKKIEELLRQSRQDFGFDSDNIKARLMMAVNARHFSFDDAKRLTFNPSTWPKYAFGATLALVLVLSTSGLAFASTKSKPGEILFPVQKLQNQIVLSLPLSSNTKAQISTNIVAKRLKELEEIQKNPDSKPSQVSAEVKEIQASIQKAASYVPEVSDSTPEKQDNGSKISKKKADIEKTTNRLESLSAKHQATLKSLSAKTTDDKLKIQIDKSVENISATQEELHQKGKSNSDSKDSDGLPQSKNTEEDKDSSTGQNSGSIKLDLKLNTAN